MSGQTPMKLVQTQSSAYLWDRQARTVIRLSGQGANTDGSWVCEQLRRDGEPLSLLTEPEPPQVGLRWGLMLAVREDGIGTWRSTTPVVAVSDYPRERKSAG